MAQERPKRPPEGAQRPTGAAQDRPREGTRRPRSGPRAPEVPRRAQNGCLDVKTFGFYKVFAPPDLKNVGLAEVFKRKV